MSDEPLTEADLDKVRDGGTRPDPEPPCSSCGVAPVWDEPTFMWHYFHSEDCRVAARIRERLEAGEYDRYRPGEGTG